MLVIKNAIIGFNFLIAGLIVVVAWTLDHQLAHYKFLDDLLHGSKKETYTALAGIFGALLGFEITAYSILVTLSSSEVMKRLHKDGSAVRIYSGFTLATVVSGIAAATSLVGIFYDNDSHPHPDYTYFTLGICVWAVLAISSTIFLTDSIVTSVLDSKKIGS